MFKKNTLLPFCLKNYWKCAQLILNSWKQEKLNNHCFNALSQQWRILLRISTVQGDAFLLEVKISKVLTNAKAVLLDIHNENRLLSNAEQEIITPHLHQFLDILHQYLASRQRIPKLIDIYWGCIYPDKCSRIKCLNI